MLSGPNLAKEIVAGPVIASESELVRYAVQQALHSALFRVPVMMYMALLGGALMRSRWMAAAYNVGENTKSMILTRALEMSRLQSSWVQIR